MIRHATLAITLLALAGLASAGPFRIRKVVDTSTPVPGGTESVPFGFLQAATPDGEGGVAFRGGSTSLAVWFAAGGAITKVADRSTPIPGTSTTFEYFNSDTLTADAGRVGFGAEGRSSHNGLFAWEAGTVSTVVDRSTTVPGTPFGFFEWRGPFGEEAPRQSNGHFAFTHEYSAYAVAPGGGIVAIADGVTADLPGGPWNHRIVTSIDRDGTVLVSGSRAGERALFTWKDGTFTRLLDTTAAFPGGTGTFTYLSSGHGMMGLDQGTVVFYGAGENVVEAGGERRQEGVFRLAGGTLETVLTNVDPVPDLPGYRFRLRSWPGNPTQNFRGIAYHDGVTALLGYVDPDDVDGNGNEVRAIFADVDGSLCKLLSEGELFDGKIVKQLSLANTGTRGREIAFTVRFEDESRAIYLASEVIPEPGTVALLGLGLLGLAVASRSRRRRRRERD
jgi:hypothetical protein